ncbi:hypothetical protein Cpir12675_001053 [Ceratocystis pirilliformis]|uniref:Uncharacterized protein n=1 Tax=Ceratocystis pirilliformis TaxID=259994 RepID=A0ABR3ZI30_9PEZI
MRVTKAKAFAHSKGPGAHHQQHPQSQQIQKQQQQQQQQNHRHHDRTHPPLTHVRRASSQHSSPGRPRPRRASITTSILRPRRKRCSEPDVVTRSSVLQNPLMRHDQRDREGDSEPELASFSAHSISAPSSPARSRQNKQSQASHVPQAPQRPPPPPPLQQPQLQSYQQIFPHPRLVVPSLSENDYTDLRNMFCRSSQSPPRSRELSPLRKSTSLQPGLVREQISESE